MKKLTLLISAYTLLCAHTNYTARVEVPYGLGPVFDFFIEYKTLPMAHPANKNILIATGTLPHLVKTPTFFGLTLETVNQVQCVLLVEAKANPNAPVNSVPIATLVVTLPTTLVEAEFYNYTQNKELSALLHRHLAQR